MKSILVIGMGRFGRHLANKMQQLGNEIMVVDIDSELIESIADRYDNSYIGNCNNEAVIEALDVKNFDLCFVCIGEDFESSLMATSLLKKNGAKHVIAKSNQSIQEELLLKIGADEVVYPEREIAEKLAVRYNSKNIFDYVKLTSEFSIYEIPILKSWQGKAVCDININRKFKVNIIAIKNGNNLTLSTIADHVFQDDDHIVVIGKSSDVFKLCAKT